MQPCNHFSIEDDDDDEVESQPIEQQDEEVNACSECAIDEVEVFTEMSTIQCMEIMEEAVASTIEEDVPEQLLPTDTCKWKGFKIVGDNIDKNYRRRFQAIDYTTRSFHYFHCYSVLDRVDLSSISDVPKGVIDLMKVFPTEVEIEEMQEVFAILVSRYGEYINCNLPLPHLIEICFSFSGFSPSFVGHVVMIIIIIFMIGCLLNILINFMKKNNQLSGTFHMKMLEIWQKNQLW